MKVNKQLNRAYRGYHELCKDAGLPQEAVETYAKAEVGYQNRGTLRKLSQLPLNMANPLAQGEDLLEWGVSLVGSLGSAGAGIASQHTSDIFSKGSLLLASGVTGICALVTLPTVISNSWSNIEKPTFNSWNWISERQYNDRRDWVYNMQLKGLPSFSRLLKTAAYNHEVKTTGRIPDNCPGLDSI